MDLCLLALLVIAYLPDAFVLYFKKGKKGGGGGWVGCGCVFNLLCVLTGKVHLPCCF